MTIDCPREAHNATARTCELTEFSGLEFVARLTRPTQTLVKRFDQGLSAMSNPSAHYTHKQARL
jgi:hypothetical protein